MRKLRQRIPFEDVIDWAVDKHSGWTCAAIENFRLFYNGFNSAMGSYFDDLPDSFYEQPPVGSFGKFIAESGMRTAWGHLRQPDTTSQDRPFTCEENGMYYEHFTPGLPQDVDEFGMPLEKNDE